MRNAMRLPTPVMKAALCIGPLAAACVGLVAAAAPCVHAEEFHASLAVFGNLPSVEDMAMSPDGTKFAYVRTQGDQRSVLIRQLGESKPLGAFRVGDTKLRALRWMDDDNLLITRSGTGGPPPGYVGGGVREWFQLASYSLSKQKLADVDFQVHGNILQANAVFGTPSIRTVDGATLLFAQGTYGASSILPALFKYSVADSRAWLIEKADAPLAQWTVDEAGRVAAQFIYRDDRKQWEIALRRDDRMVVAASGNAEIDLPSIRGFSADGAAIIVEFIENGDPVWKPLMLKDGSWGPALAKGAALSGVIVDRKSGRIIGGVPHVEDDSNVFFDAELQAHWDAALRAFANERVELISYSDDFARILVRVFGPRDGYAYALFDWYTHRATVLAPVYDGLGVPSEVKRITYKAGDGFSIPAYLTLPHAAGDQNWPLIVLPHGGPAAADSLRFDWWAQALAAQGYAVLQPNYRGSSLSYRYMAAGFGEWGRKMQTDLSDGVRYLAAQGVIDPKRVCIVGASYGGYAALAGVTLDAPVYRCAVSVAGISDLKRFRESMGFKDNLVRRYWDRYMGTANQHDQVSAAVSPIEHVSAVNVPVLLIHGQDDTVVPYYQSLVMSRALGSARKPVEFVTLKHEDHWLSRGATRLQMLEATVAFLKTNNPPN